MNATKKCIKMDVIMPRRQYILFEFQDPDISYSSLKGDIVIRKQLKQRCNLDRFQSILLGTDKC